VTIHTALLQGVRILEEAHVSAPRLTAEVLLCHALGKERAYLFAHSDEELSELAWIHYGRYLHERTQGKPTQYITKVQEFYGRPFRVSPAVLIPRPETEHLVETVLKLAPQAQTVLDIGTGSGAIAVTLAIELKAQVWATDISFEALQVAARNAASNQVTVHLLCCDLCAGIGKACFDVVVSNPPYVPQGDQSYLQSEVRDHEPAIALYGGPTGTEIYERLIPAAAGVIKPGGWFAAELGYNSLERVFQMLEEGPWTDVGYGPDLAGIPRVIRARYAP
jgi:release factor glutamine methyltransferase